MVHYKIMPYAIPAYIIPLLILFMQILPNEGILCYKCSYINHEAGRRGIFDRTQSSPSSSCDEMDYCEGEWCVQQFNGGNVTFSCAQHAPLQESLFDSGIDSQCQAYYGANNIIHEVCYCKTSDFCNTSSANYANFLIIIAFMSIYLMIL